MTIDNQKVLNAIEKLIWKYRTPEDLKDIEEYLDKNNPEASKIVKEIEEAELHLIEYGMDEFAPLLEKLKKALFKK